MPSGRHRTMMMTEVVDQLEEVLASTARFVPCSTRWRQAHN